MAVRPYPSFLIYLDASQQYRWRLQASNHRTIADSAEAYHNFNDCRDAISLIKSPHPVWQTTAVTESLR